MSYYANLDYGADPRRYMIQQALRATDEMCAWCKVEDCPERNMGGYCPMDVEDLEAQADHQELRGQVYGVQSGTSRF